MVRILIACAVGIAASWVLLIVALAISGRRLNQSLQDVMRMLPNALRLLVAILRDRAVPRRVRWQAAAALAYAGQPFNLIPDWIPVVGYADNVVVISWALRSAVRSSGDEVVSRHWRGTEQELAVLYRALRLAPSSRNLPRPIAALTPSFCEAADNDSNELELEGR